MPDVAVPGLFMSATFALNITPGPDMLYVIGRSVGQGRLSGMMSALGVAAGTMFHVAAVALGLSAFLAAAPAAYAAVRIVGGCYLVYLGAKAIRSATQAREQIALTPASMTRVFTQGVTTNVLNPKVGLFFLAFLPQFADRATGSVGRQLLALGLLFNASGTLVNVAVACFASAITSRTRESSTGQRMLQRLTGALFIGLGLRLLASSQR